VLPALAGGKLLPARVAQQLESAYLFLRRLENRLQMLADAQTHTVPADALTRERIALAMGLRNWETCAAELELHRARVTRAFQEVLFARNEGIVPAPEANHAVKGAIDEAIKCKEEGVGRTILFNLCGHGHFDMQAYMDYFAGKLVDQDYDPSELAMALAGLPSVKAAA